MPGRLYLKMAFICGYSPFRPLLLYSRLSKSVVLKRLFLARLPVQSDRTQMAGVLGRARHVPHAQSRRPWVRPEEAQDLHPGHVPKLHLRTLASPTVALYDSQILQKKKPETIVAGCSFMERSIGPSAFTVGLDGPKGRSLKTQNLLDIMGNNTWLLQTTPSPFSALRQTR